VKYILSPLFCLSLVSCGGGGTDTPITQPPVESTPPIQNPTQPDSPVATNPIDIPQPPPPLEPVVVVPPMPVDPTPPTIDNSTEPSNSYVHGVAPNRTTVPPTPPVGMYSIYRSELTNSTTPWNEYIGSFKSLDEAEARFKNDDDPLMYGEEFQYLIMTGIPNDIYWFSWPCSCIPR
jgi:hypothetical protein